MARFSNTLLPLCVVCLFILGLAVVYNQGILLFEFGESRILIDSRQD